MRKAASVLVSIALAAILSFPLAAVAEKIGVGKEEATLVFFRLIVNEAGWERWADADGIYRAAVRGARKKDGTIDFSRLVWWIATTSPRVFPADSPFVARRDIASRLARSGQSSRHRWTSGLRLDCSEPENWPAEIDWKAYRERCERTVRIARAFVSDKIPSRCDGDPMTWGSEADVYRPGGPIELKWKEVFCDPRECRNLSFIEREKRSDCALNRFWTWERTETEGRKK